MGQIPKTMRISSWLSLRVQALLHALLQVRRCLRQFLAAETMSLIRWLEVVLG